VGNTYENVTVCGLPPQTAVEILKGRDTYVGPVVNGCLVVLIQPGDYDVAAELSRKAPEPVLMAGVYDSDVFYFQIYWKGKKISDYDSWSNYGQDSGPPIPRGGNISQLCKSWYAKANCASMMRKVLYPGDAKMGVFDGLERHQKLIKLLGLPGYAYDLNYTDIKTNQLPGGMRLEQFTKTL